jgi:hypothetical protein
VAAKAPTSMRVNSEFISNEIDESEVQDDKDDEQRIWTWRGIVIDLREEQSEMLSIRCVLIRNPFQTK